MKISEALSKGGEGAILADENNGIVRLWTLTSLFRDGRAMRALKRFFPHLEVRGEIIRLGGFNTLVEAQYVVAEAKINTFSFAVRRLFRFDVPESLKTIKHYS